MREPRLIYVLTGAILVFLTWFFLIPKIGEIIEAQKVLSQEEKQLQKLKMKLADLESLNEYELSERVNLSLRAVPEKKNVVSVMTNIRVVAEENGLAVESLRVSPGSLTATGSGEKKSQSLENINFKVEISGPLSSLLSFIRKIESYLPVAVLEQIKIVQEGETAKVALSISSYSLPMPQTLGKIDTPLVKLNSEEEKVLKEISTYTFLPQISFPPASGRTNPFSF